MPEPGPSALFFDLAEGCRLATELHIVGNSKIVGDVRYMMSKPDVKHMPKAQEVPDIG